MITTATRLAYRAVRNPRNRLRLSAQHKQMHDPASCLWFYPILPHIQWHMLGTRFRRLAPVCPVRNNERCNHAKAVDVVTLTVAGHWLTAMSIRQAGFRTHYPTQPKWSIVTKDWHTTWSNVTYMNLNPQNSSEDQGLPMNTCKGPSDRRKQNTTSRGDRHIQMIYAEYTCLNATKLNDKSGRDKKDMYPKLISRSISRKNIRDKRHAQFRILRMVYILVL